MSKKRKILTADEAAEMMKVSKSTLKEMEKDGLVTYHTPGGHRRFRVSNILEYLEGTREKE